MRLSGRASVPALVTIAAITMLATLPALPRVLPPPSSSSVPTPTPAPSNPAPSTPAPSPPAVAHPPVLAYYYIWFSPSTWEHGKSDLSAFGKYSSDNLNVIRRQIEAAKQAGIDGFLVSWKHTTALDRRLAKVVDVAESENFKLGVIYEGLDFSRRPLPASAVTADLGYFSTTFGGRAPFRLFAKPLVVWSGTWKSSRSAISAVTPSLRRSLLVLASEKSAADYAAKADLFDGDAYYWSSVNPATQKGYPQKLVDMGATVHRQGGLWVAPAGPGFDARLVGGKSIVSRKDGQTLATEVRGALSSSPDVLGIISWNEFSESSQIEPSHSFGRFYVEKLGQILGVPGSAPAAVARTQGPGDFDSSSPGTHGPPMGIIVLVGLVLFLGGLTWFGFRGGPRRRRDRRARPGRGRSERTDGGADRAASRASAPPPTELTPVVAGHRGRPDR